MQNNNRIKRNNYYQPLTKLASRKKKMSTRPNTPLLIIIIFISIGIIGSAKAEFKRDSAINPHINDIVERQLKAGLTKYNAIGALAVVMNAKTGKVIASSSLYTDLSTTQNHAAGLYQIESVLRTATIAMGLQSKKISMHSRFDARKPIKIGKWQIRDSYPQNRTLSLSEVFMYSSNIATARIALRNGSEYQTLFLRLLGLRDATENGVEPRFPHETSTLTTSITAIGRGVEITPLHAAGAIATLTSMDGRVVRPTLRNKKVSGLAIIDPDVSAKIRFLMRQNVEIGAAKVIDIEGYNVGGVTATSNKIKNGKYSNDSVVTTMAAIVPSEDPEYIFIVLLDEPKSISETHGYISAGWNAGKITAAIISDTVLPLGQSPKESRSGYNSR